MFIDFPDLSILEQFLVKGIAACFPVASENRLVKWMIINDMVLNPSIVLHLTDQLIQKGKVERRWYEHRCSRVIVYNLTNSGLEELRVLTRQS